MNVLGGFYDGAGGFYDALGASPRSDRLGATPHGAGPAADPIFLFAPLVQFDEGRHAMGAVRRAARVPRVVWHHWAQPYGDTPLSLRYEGLDAHAQYRVRLVYSYQGWGGRPVARLYALGRMEGGAAAGQAQAWRALALVFRAGGRHPGQRPGGAAANFQKRFFGAPGRPREHAAGLALAGQLGGGRGLRGGVDGDGEPRRRL